MAVWGKKEERRDSRFIADQLAVYRQYMCICKKVGVDNTNTLQ